MGTDFKASNGWHIDAGGSLYEAPDSIVVHVRDMDAARQFFLEERDHELGRWRDPEDSGLIVQPSTWNNAKGVYVWPEREPWKAQFYQRLHFPGTSGWLADAARHYFEAHPQRKPWHDAKPGEVWVLTFGDRVPDHAYLATDYGTFDSHSAEFSMNDPQIVDARCIWPEGGGDDE